MCCLLGSVALGKHRSNGLIASSTEQNNFHVQVDLAVCYRMGMIWLLDLKGKYLWFAVTRIELQKRALVFLVV